MIKIRKYKNSDLVKVALLVKNTFKKFNSREYFKEEAIKNYLSQYNIDKNSKKELIRRFKKTPIFYVATENNKIIGAIRGKKDKITNLFIDKNYHQRGIGKKLVEKFETEVIKQRLNKIKIHSSLYAIPFYKKMGYKKSTGIRNFHGLKVQPMKKVL